MTGLTAGYRRRDGRVARYAQRGTVDVGGPETEAARVDVGRAVAPGAVAIQAAERNVVAGRGGDLDVGKRAGHGRSVAAQAARHPLVSAGDRVGRVVARCRVALRARRRGRNVVRRLSAGSHIIREGGCRRMTAAAIAGGRMNGIERRRWARIPRHRPRAGEHAEVARRLVTGLTSGYRRRDRGVTGHGQRRTVNARRPDVESARVHIAHAVAAGAVAIQVAGRNVIAGRGGDLDVGKRPGHRRTVAAEAGGHALVSCGDRVGRVVTRRRVALRARRGGRNVIGRLARTRHIAGEGGCRRMTAPTVAGGWMNGIERRRRARIPY